MVITQTTTIFSLFCSSFRLPRDEKIPEKKGQETAAAEHKKRKKILKSSPFSLSRERKGEREKEKKEKRRKSKSRTTTMSIICFLRCFLINAGTIKNSRRCRSNFGVVKTICSIAGIPRRSRRGRRKRNEKAEKRRKKKKRKRKKRERKRRRRKREKVIKETAAAAATAGTNYSVLILAR